MVGQLVAQSRPSRTAVVLGLGDYFHANDATAQTPRSRHVLDVDGRWPRTLKAGVHMAMDIIALAASRHERVLARFLPGNHDPDASVALTVALAVAYAGHDRVAVDETPSAIWYHRHGRVLLGATHGHTMRPDRMAMLLASDRPEDWGATRWRHFFFRPHPSRKRARDRPRPGRELRHHRRQGRLCPRRRLALRPGPHRAHLPRRPWRDRPPPRDRPAS